MIKVIIGIMAILCLTFAYDSLADPYGGVAITHFDVDRFDSTAITMTAGYQVDEWIGLEARYYKGVEGDRVNGVYAEIEDAYGAYLKFGPKLWQFRPYFLFGITEGQAVVEINGFVVKDREADMSSGAGLQWGGESSYFYVEWLRPVEDVDAITLGIMVDF